MLYRLRPFKNIISAPDPPTTNHPTKLHSVAGAMLGQVIMNLAALLKLFLELFKLLPQAFYFRGQRLNLFFKRFNSVAIARSTRRPRTGLFFGKLLDIHFAREQMRKAGLL